MQVTLRRFRQMSIVMLVMLVVVVVAGAVVRLTDSGLGCADWPRCSEERFIDVSSTHSAIEQLNRIYSALVGVAAVVLFAAALLVRPRRRDLIGWATAVVVGVGANGVIGGVSVRVDLHPVAVQAHLLLALFCVAGATVLVHRSAPVGTRRVIDGRVRVAVVVLCVMSGAALVTGTTVTGAGPHAGDAEAARIDLAIPTIARVHSGSVIAALVAALAVAALARRVNERHLMRVMSTWIAIALLQAVIGWVQYLNDVPEVLVATHVLGATIVTWATTQVALAAFDASSRIVIKT